MSNDPKTDWHQIQPRAAWFYQTALKLKLASHVKLRFCFHNFILLRSGQKTREDYRREVANWP